jgi:hypothetical protein
VVTHCDEVVRPAVVWHDCVRKEHSEQRRVSYEITSKIFEFDKPRHALFITYQQGHTEASPWGHEKPQGA